MIRQGPTDMFSIDKNTGVIKTIRGLDYEKEVQHVLVIGTLENPGNKPGATTKVIVNVEVGVCLDEFGVERFYLESNIRFLFVQDVNDIPPVFLSIPQPITLDDDVPIGTKVTTLIATDSDGTSPNNKVNIASFSLIFFLRNIHEIFTVSGSI